MGRTRWKFPAHVSVTYLQFCEHKVCCQSLGLTDFHIQYCNVTRVKDQLYKLMEEEGWSIEVAWMRGW